jgi:hypothetical protein
VIDGPLAATAAPAPERVPDQQAAFADVQATGGDRVG